MSRLRNYFITTISGCDKHTRAGLEILRGGGGRIWIRPNRAKGARTSGGGSGGMLPQEVLKNGVFLMPFLSFGVGFLCIEQVTMKRKY